MESWQPMVTEVARQGATAEETLLSLDGGVTESVLTGDLLDPQRIQMFLVSGLGLEPRTNALKGRCSTD
jgi:hypothetical protein